MMRCMLMNNNTMYCLLYNMCFNILRGCCVLIYCVAVALSKLMLVYLLILLFAFVKRNKLIMLDVDMMMCFLLNMLMLGIVDVF